MLYLLEEALELPYVTAGLLTISFVSLFVPLAYTFLDRRREQ